MGDQFSDGDKSFRHDSLVRIRKTVEEEMKAKQLEDLAKREAQPLWPRDRDSVPREYREDASIAKLEDPAKKDLVDDEMINHPSHYNNGSIECIDYIEDQGFGYHVGCAVKYCARYRFKGTPVKDLRKAAWYLLRMADRLEAKNGS